MKLGLSALEVALLLVGMTAMGYAVLRPRAGRISRAESIACALACALLVQAILVLALLALSVRPGLLTLLAANAGVALLFGSLPRPRRDAKAPAPGNLGRLSMAARLLLAVAALGCVRFFLESAAEPMWATDFLAIWGLKGRTIFATGAIPPRLFHDPALAWAHPEYPLLVPLVLAALSFALGSWNDQALAILYPACQIGVVLAVFGFLRRRVPGRGAPAAAGAALASWCVGLYSAGNVGTAEVLLALALVLLAEAFLDLLREDSGGVRFRLAAASLFAAAVKQEGTLFAILLAAGLALHAWRARRFHTRAFAALLGPPFLQLLLMRALRGPVVRRDFDWTLASPARWPELSRRLGETAERIGSVELPSAAIAVAALALVLFATRRSFADALLGPLAAQALVYAFVCAFSAFSPGWAVASAFSRITLALVPALSIVLAARLGATREPDASA